MHHLQIPSAISAPPATPEALQAARIAARVGVSTSVARVLAGLAWGSGGRDHNVMLAAVTTARTAPAMGAARG